MADLSLLISRGAAHFTADTRFAGLDPGWVEQAPELQILTPLPANPITQAYETGFSEGIAAARADALAQVEIVEATRDRLGFSFSRLDTELAETLRQRLLATVVALCEATLAPLTLDRPALAGRVERATALFMRADDERVIRLHPDDLAAAQGLLPPDWVFKPDAGLERGALRVETQSGGAEDGPAQWRQAITEALDLC